MRYILTEVNVSLLHNEGVEEQISKVLPFYEIIFILVHPNI